MRKLIEFIPIFLFFITFKTKETHFVFKGYDLTLGGILSATLVLIISSLIVNILFFLKDRKLEKRQWFTLSASLLLGGLTLFFRNEIFLQWKAPIINFTFAFVFILNHWTGRKLFAKSMMESSLSLPDNIWRNLNLIWIVFFLFCGLTNAFIVLYLPAIWVDFKVFGSLVMSLVFLIVQVIYLRPHLPR